MSAPTPSPSSSSSSSPSPASEPREPRRIPLSNLARLESRIAAMTRRAARLGIAAPELVVGPVEILETRRDSDHATGELALIERREVVPVSIIGRSPVLDGWRLVAVLDHDTPDARPYVAVVPGEVAPADAESRAASCDHCRTARRRLETFIVANVDGRLAWVGRNCLADYLGGASVEALLLWASWISELSADLDDDGVYGGSGSYVDPWYDSATYLGFVVASIKVNGWMSRSKARELAASKGVDVVATASDALSVLTWPASHPKPRPYAPTPDQQLEAQAALAWAQALSETDGDDYLAKLGRVARWGVVSARYTGILASCIAAHRRATRIAEERASRPVSKHLGVPKQRLRGLVARVIFQTTLEGDWGTTTLYRLVTPTGEILVYFSSRDLELATRSDVVFDATIKRHDVSKRDGQLETIITRATVKSVTAPAAPGDPAPATPPNHNPASA